mmetsp:Transcript_24008/g.75328  ORF Transcript_24008/g.75328 Transcript_24008/m.75328 type:complete len:280 (-) Transcript_24008:152-991(-)
MRSGRELLAAVATRPVQRSRGPREDSPALGEQSMVGARCGGMPTCRAGATAFCDALGVDLPVSPPRPMLCWSASGGVRRGERDVGGSCAQLQACVMSSWTTRFTPLTVWPSRRGVSCGEPLCSGAASPGTGGCTGSSRRRFWPELLASLHKSMRWVNWFLRAFTEACLSCSFISFCSNCCRSSSTSWEPVSLGPRAVPAPLRYAASSASRASMLALAARSASVTEAYWAFRPSCATCNSSSSWCSSSRAVKSNDQAGRRHNTRSSCPTGTSGASTRSSR